jgi:serine/threonine protein kinase
MGEPSFFFADPGCGMTTASELECIYQSESGHSVLYRVQREGKFRVLKALKEEYRTDPFFQGLLRKEFEIGWELDHPGICRTFDFREVEGLGPCIELEWVDGCTLEELYANGPVARELEVQIFAEICDALSYLHHKQVFHRDLKPENILITHKGSHCKLIDFGLSDTDTHATHKESAGTVVYAAPEVLRGDPADARSDIFSLGRILFEVSDRFTGVALKCMDRKPEKRYASTDEVKAALLRKRPTWIWWAIAGLALVASVLAGGYLFSRGTQADPKATPDSTAIPQPPLSQNPTTAPTSPAAPGNDDINDLFEEVSKQIVDAQKR